MVYDVVIFGMNKYRDWRIQEKRQRSYYILQEIKKHPAVGKILYIDYLPVKRAEAINDYFSFFRRLIRRVFHLTPYSVANTIQPGKLYNYATIGSVINWQWVYADLIKLLGKLDFKNVLIWSYDPLNVDFFDTLEQKTTVFDVDVDWRTRTDFHNGHKIDYLDVLRKNYNRMANCADFIFTASDELLEIFMGHDQSYWLPDLGRQQTDWKKLVDEMFTIIQKKKL